MLQMPQRNSRKKQFLFLGIKKGSNDSIATSDDVFFECEVLTNAMKVKDL